MRGVSVKNKVSGGDYIFFSSIASGGVPSPNPVLWIANLEHISKRFMVRYQDSGTCFLIQILVSHYYVVLDFGFHTLLGTGCRSTSYNSPNLKSKILGGSFFIRIHVPPHVRSGLQICCETKFKTGGKKKRSKFVFFLQKWA